MYDVNINNPYHTVFIAPNCDILDPPLLSDVELKDSYTILMKGINEWRVQLSTNKTLLSVNKKGEPSILILQKLLQQTSLYLLTMLNYMSGLLTTNLQDVGTDRIFVIVQFSKNAIKKAIHKSPHDVQPRHLFRDENNGQQNQFWGFMLSHRTSNVLNSFHIHSFAVFYTDKQKCTIVKCILTIRVHILSNMQDCVLQLMQLI